MIHKIVTLAGALAMTAAAQATLSNYLGPGILTHGAGDIGTRAGQQLDLRFYGKVSGIYDNGIQPISIDSSGQLAEVNALAGVEAGIGAYGVHQWRRALLGLDYRGDFRHYTDDSFYDGSDHQLLLGYTWQKSRRFYLDTQQVAGTFSRFLGAVPGFSVAVPTTIDQPTLLLFDNRTYFIDSGLDATFLTSARTSLTVGGQGFAVRRQSKLLAGMNGYGLHGFVQHRVSRTTSIGVGYQHQHFDYPGVFGEADIDAYQLSYATQFGRFWTFSARGGIYRTEVQGLEQVSLDPAIASILGISNVSQTFYRKNKLPSVEVNLSRQFKRAVFSMQYARTVSPGNGVYLTSRSETGGATIAYSGVRRFTFFLSGGYSSLAGLGQSLQSYSQAQGGTGVGYALTHAIHLESRYDARHQEIDLAGYRRTSYRVTFGLAFSPGDLPLSLW